MMRGSVLVVAGVLSLAGRAVAADANASTEEHVRGDVVSVKGDVLGVKTRTGDAVRVDLPADVPIAQAEKAKVQDVRDGAFVGLTTIPERDGTLRAVEVHVFPEAMRGTGEGSRGWDLRPGSSMTNGTVASASGQPQQSSTMTNGTVAGVASAGAGRKVEEKYKGEQKTVIIPPSAAVVKLEPADRSALKPGAHVFAIAKRQPDGTLLAQRLMVGEGKVRPPM